MAISKYRIGDIPEKKIKIDAKDCKLLSLLSEDSRLSLTQLAKKVALSRDAVNYRIKRLEQKGIILKFFPEIDFEKMGYTVFHIYLLIDEGNKERKIELLEHLKKHPNVQNIIEFSDKWDFRITILAKNLKEFDRILGEIISEHSDIIIAKENNALIKEYYGSFLPDSFKTIKPDIRFPSKLKPMEKMKIDSKDLQILKALSQNCRASTYDISKSVKLSPDAIGYRIKKIIASSIIKRFTTLINLSGLGYSWYTYSMLMRKFDSEEEAKFKEFVNEHPYILRAIKTLGTWDLKINIVCDSPANFHNTIKELKNTFSSTIKNYETWIAYKEHYYQNFPKVLEESNDTI